MLACDRCHARKTKCDRRIPKCSSCEKAKVPCLHTDKLQQRNFPRGYMAEMEKRLRGLEEENRRLRGNLTSPSHRSDGPNMRGPSFSEQGDRFPGGLQSPPPTAQLEDAASGISPQTDAVVNEVEMLSTRAATGESRYLGSSSGVEFAHIVQSVIDSASLRSNLFASMSDAEGVRDRPTPKVPKNAPPPSQEVALPLLDAYWHSWHITFPLVHRPSFLRMVDRIFSDPEYYQKNIFDAYMFDMVLAMGSTNLNRHDWLVSSTESHFGRAMHKLEDIMKMKGIRPLQALLCCCQYGVFCSLRDTSTNVWHLLGIAARYVVELGLHREVSIRASSGGTSSQETILEAEMKRRCLWCFYCLDRAISITLGRPVALRDDDIDTAFPSPLEDDELDPDILMSDSGHRIRRSYSSHSSPFLLVIRIRRISGKIKQTLYSIGTAESTSLREKFRIRQEIRSELEAWKADVASMNFSDHSEDEWPLTTFSTPCWYETLFHNAMLLLYRPSPMFPYPGKRNESEDEEDDLKQLLHAAKCSLNGYAELLRKRRLNYSWITLYTVFMAGLAYVYSVERCLKAYRRDTASNHIPGYLEVINDTRNCSNILVAICERWNEARSSCEIFDRLSSAVIQDTINASVSIKNPQYQTLPSPHRSLSSIVTMTQPYTPHHPHNPPISHDYTGLTSLLAATEAAQASTSTTSPPPRGMYHMPTMTPLPAPASLSGTPMQSSYDQQAAFISGDIQHCFQDMQSAVFHDNFTGPNEVMLGFGCEWFERETPLYGEIGGME